MGKLNDIQIDQQQLLSNLLRNNGFQLKTNSDKDIGTLENVAAQYLNISEEQLHSIISEELSSALIEQKLPTRLGYIYNDPTVIVDYKKFPYLITSCKITLQMLSYCYQQKVTLFQLTKQCNKYYLNALIINNQQNNNKSSMLFAKIGNKFYMVKSAEQMNKQKQKQNLKVNSIKSEFFTNEFKLNYRASNQTMNSTSTQQKINQQNDIPMVMQSKLNEQDYIADNNQEIDSNKYMQAMNNNMYYNYYYNQRYHYYNQSGNGQANLSYNRVEINLHNISPSKNNNQDHLINYQSLINAHQYHQQAMYVQSIPNCNQQQYSNTNYSPPHSSQSPASNNQENQRYTGRLKFFDEAKSYGFIIRDVDSCDIFVHYDDLQRAGIAKERIKSYRQNQVMEYFGKYKHSRKAIDLSLIQDIMNGSQAFKA